MFLKICLEERLRSQLVCEGPADRLAHHVDELLAVILLLVVALDRRLHLAHVVMRLRAAVLTPPRAEEVEVFAAASSDAALNDEALSDVALAEAFAAVDRSDEIMRVLPSPLGGHAAAAEQVLDAIE
ncbi:hypothetical protein ACFOYW_18255 [Gryllotalpicola reticulitermitis]|uniref:Uncharacterized protein n=1 Tax=Gryllotalpicola reticulitermitis TaxID=1184153 RepID=A0ABV8QAD1_9MICO